MANSIDESGYRRPVGMTSEEITERTKDMKEKFIERYIDLASITRTCKEVQMTRRNFYQWLENDPEFKAKFKIADAMALGVLEDEAHRRAVDGTLRPVFQGGKHVGDIREYSDTLMIVLLKARAPHKYKDRFSGELMGANGQPLIPETKIIHVHSNIPLAHNEEDIIQDAEFLPPIELPATNSDELDMI